MARYTFSGHESFYCKSLWLKKGYDALKNNINFSNPEAVAELGVGKNMVSSIKFWLKAFGVSNTDAPTHFGDLIFDSQTGYDPYIEDTGTLWLLHYMLVKNKLASIYNLTFLEFKREKKEFDRIQLQSFIKRKCNVKEQSNVYNENTVRKDISVLLHNYVSPTDLKSPEDYSAILIDLGLISNLGDDKYAFSEISHEQINPLILLYILNDYKGNDNTISLDIMQEISLILGISINGLVEIVKTLIDEYTKDITYSDNSGIKNIQFLRPIDSDVVLNEYYNR